ncbi:MAG: ribonuclease P protein component [Usitatibacter sp.]
MPRNARREGYSRRHRFAERGSFGPVLRAPRKLRGRLAIVHVMPAASLHSRLGLALTRRLVPSAVDRNMVKRMVRETFRRHDVKQSGFDCVVTLREKFQHGQAPQIAAEVSELLDRLGSAAA